jgi:hypothetical protein
MPVGIFRTFRDFDVLEYLGNIFIILKDFYYVMVSNNFNGKMWSHSIK